MTFKPHTSGVLPEQGVRVQVAKLESTKGMMIVPSQLSNRRRAGTEGIYSGIYAGHGGDVWAVTHDDGTVAAYCYTELLVEVN